MISIYDFLEKLTTDSGWWNPLVWSVVIVIAFLIIYIIRGFGKKGYKEETEQTKVFLSGNPEYEKEKMHVKASNVYWGFMESLKWVYKVLEKMHTGNVSDYVLWFVVIIGVLFIIMGVI
jgi:C4-dicarboxylate transporter